jgi:ParB/RepB/Spo0J family partition protein
MEINAANSELEMIPVGLIERNPQNPRLYFRPKELEELLDSIRQYGIQVPVSLYREGDHYVLIDGERRWRCASKLNMKRIPALVQEKPSALANILLMFNIHALREQWDLLTIALKLQDVIDLVTEQTGKNPTEIELSKRTGLSRGVVRRCRYLLGLPDEYRAMVLDELKKPKQQQRLTEDFFIEMERSLKTVQRAMPEAVPDKDEVRRVLVEKFKHETINNRVHFRLMGKIARAKTVGADEESAKRALKRLFSPNKYSIQKAFEESVEAAYQERDTAARVSSLVAHLEGLSRSDLDDDIRVELRRLQQQITRLLGPRK